MSAVIERRSPAGVILRYETVARRSFHDEPKPRPADRFGCSLLKAERKIRVLWIIAECIEVSDCGYEAIADALKTIEATLTLARAELGLRVDG